MQKRGAGFEPRGSGGRSCEKKIMRPGVCRVNSAVKMGGWRGEKEEEEGRKGEIAAAFPALYCATDG